VTSLIIPIILIFLGAAFAAQNDRVIPVHLLVWRFTDMSESTLVLGSVLFGAVLGAGLVWRVSWRHTHRRQTVGTRMSPPQQTLPR
jgi:uncharacterized integral membrane protein